MNDINTAIAKYKGWTPENGLKLPVQHTITIENGLCLPPDFEHDARLYMALFEEMKSHCKRVDLGWKVDHYFCIAYDYAAVAHADTIGTAICLAYCKLNGLECEG